MQTTILIVEDNAQNLNLVDKIFKNSGFQTIKAKNGADALEAARQTPPDVIVSDILMPVMDGFTLCRNWNQDPVLRNIPFVFYTATYTDSRDEKLALSLGAARFLVKPSEPDVLTGTVRNVLQEFKQKNHSQNTEIIQSEETVLANYNAVLVHKLEKKVQELAEANQALEKEVAQRIQTEKVLNQTEETLRRVFAAIAGGIIIIDLKYMITDCNDNALSMAGVKSKSELIGKSILSFLRGDEIRQARDVLEETIIKGSSHKHQYTIHRSDGSTFPVEVSSCAARDNNNVPIFLVVSFSNISERKQMENRIIDLYKKEKKQRLELQEEANARGLFIEVLSHELRTPLTPILASAGMLEDILKPQPDNIQHRLTANINAGAKNLVERLEELLDLANYSRGTFRLLKTRVNITDLIKEVLKGFQPVVTKQYQRLVLECSSEFPEVEVDTSRFKLVMINLISNACKFSPPGSVIKINVKLDGNHLRVDVADSGAGISEEEQKRLFQPYHRVEQDRQKYPGIGLGLAICKQIIDAHKGKIWVSSQPEKGSVFSFTIPVNL